MHELYPEVPWNTAKLPFEETYYLFYYVGINRVQWLYDSWIWRIHDIRFINRRDYYISFLDYFPGFLSLLSDILKSGAFIIDLWDRKNVLLDDSSSV